MSAEKPPLYRRLAQEIASKLEKEFQFLQDRQLPVSGYTVTIGISPDFKKTDIRIAHDVASIKLE